METRVFVILAVGGWVTTEVVTFLVTPKAVDTTKVKLVVSHKVT